jgi:hypothetical protein
MKKLLVHEWVKNDNLDTWMISCKPLRLQTLPFVYLGTVKLGIKNATILDGMPQVNRNFKRYLVVYLVE